MGTLSVKGIFLGGIVDVVATNILATPIVIYAARAVDLVHTPKDQMQAVLTAALHANPMLFAAQILIGVGCSILGGYLAARIARHDELANGALSAWLCIALGVYAMVWGQVTGSVLMQAADFILAPAAGLLGGYLRLQQVRAAAQRKPQAA